MATAVVELDELHARETHGSAGLDGDTATWRAARGAAGALADSFITDGVAVVIVEGSFQTERDRQVFAETLGSTPDVYVSLVVTYDEALRRARSDPTRGISRDPGFLRTYFEGLAASSRPDTDLVIDTESITEKQAVAVVVRAVLAALKDKTAGGTCAR